MADGRPLNAPRRISIIAGFCGAVVALLTLAGCQNDQAGTPAVAGGPQFEKVQIAGEIFNLELATNDQTRGRGLGGRDSLPPDGGMMFIFKRPDYRTFWMYDCIIDIDLLYLDGNGWIVTAHEMTVEAPRSPTETVEQYQGRLVPYVSSQRAQFVIELPTGTIDRLGLDTGQKITLDLPRLKALAE